jgi:hypothetical protein
LLETRPLPQESIGLRKEAGRRARGRKALPVGIMESILKQEKKA